MIHTRQLRARSHEWLHTGFSTSSRAGCLALLLNLATCSALAEPARTQEGPREAYIPILCVTTGDKPTGTVMYLIMMFATRDDSNGLDVHFLSGPGRFSEKAQTAMKQTITGAARAMGLSTAAWNVDLSVPYPGLIIDGASLSAMVGLAAVAMAKGETVPRHHVISGTITSDGRIGTVGHVELKVAAASQAGLRTVLIPSTVPSGWRQPPSTQVSRVSTITTGIWGAHGAPESSRRRPLAGSRRKPIVNFARTFRHTKENCPVTRESYGHQLVILHRMHDGDDHNDPAIMPIPATRNPTNCGGQIESDEPANSIAIQLIVPAKMAHRAP